MKKSLYLIRCIVLVVCGIALASTTASGQANSDKILKEHQATISYINGGVSESSLVSGAGQKVMKTERGGGLSLSKTTGSQGRKSFFMNGNKVGTQVYNSGAIAPGYGLIRGLNNGVWRSLSYIFQFGPIVGASVPNAFDPTKRLHIISDALNDYPGLREVNPAGDTLWQWEPLPGYDDPEQSSMASNPAVDVNRDGKPDSWPRAWYNPVLGKYVWPGYLSQDVPAADLEVFWAMDDRDNSEFAYFPFANDSTRRGIGVRIDGRGFQWANALAENTIFFVYTITNTSNKDLDTLFFGIYGDPDIGGGSPENTDDNGYFIPPYDTTGAISNVPVYSRSMVYFWDQDMKGDQGLPLGYMGCKFLESPGNGFDGKDNDGDGMIDERQDDGIDNDHDWNAVNDDVGLDGIPNTNDPGEGDGVPTAGVRLPDGSLDPLHTGEPNFELTDLDEADQIGLTSFNSWTWSQDKISNDESMWLRSIPRNFGAIQNNQDIVFIFGSGYISLKKAETKRISMALLFGESLDDLLTSARTVQTIYNQNYRFFKPPIVPHASAVPGDKKVTLYWDTKAEESVDPITGKDFEGYVIYRSTDPTFNDIQNITDGKGSTFLSQPLKDVNGTDCRWDVDKRDEPFTDRNGNGRYDAGEPYTDLNHDGVWTAQVEDVWKGYHPVPYADRGVHYFLGTNRGLVHTYVDSNNVINGQTYYYAVVAYDHGDSIGIPPTETTKKITVDPITSLLTFDPNTLRVIPGPRASGYVAPQIGAQNITHDAGIGNGSIQFSVMNDLVVPEGSEYRLSFGDSLIYNGKSVKAKNYTILNVKPVTEAFVPFDTNFVQLSHQGIAIDNALKVTDNSGTTYTYGVDYAINAPFGTIRRTGVSRMTNHGTFTVSYRYYPVFQSELLKGSDANPVFEGISVKVVDYDKLDYDAVHSQWVQGSSRYDFVGRLTNLGTKRAMFPADYEITFSSQNIDSAVTQSGGVIRIPVRYSVKEVTTGVPQRIWTFLNENTATKNRQWDPGEEIVLFKPGARGLTTDTTTWGVVVTKPADTTIASHIPTDGDVLRIVTTRPFDNLDAYTLKTEAYKMDTKIASNRLDKIYVVPNPYVGVNDLEPANRLPSQSRGERRIYFENLPQRCTIRVFTLNGDLVQTINRDAGVDNGREYWNLLNRDGFSIAYGIYVAHVDAPGIGEKIIKFAVIK